MGLNEMNLTHLEHDLRLINAGTSYRFWLEMSLDGLAVVSILPSSLVLKPVWVPLAR